MRVPSREEGHQGRVPRAYLHMEEAILNSVVPSIYRNFLLK